MGILERFNTQLFHITAFFVSINEGSAGLFLTFFSPQFFKSPTNPNFVTVDKKVSFDTANTY